MGALRQRLGSALWGGNDRFATIDAAKAAPPPSPLAPIDLTDPAQVTGVMEIAARIGEILICAGTSNSDARAQIHLAASSYGLHYCHVDIVMNTITIHTNIGAGPDKRPLTVFRVAPGLSVDFSKLSAVDKLIRSIHSGATPPAMAERLLDEIDRMEPPRGTFQTLLGWGTMGGMFAVMLGGGAFVGVVAFLVSVLVMGVSTWLAKLRLPPFYQNVVGGFIAVMPAAALYKFSTHFGFHFTPAQIIGSGIIVLVAGLTLVQCLVDGITRAPVTSAARFFEAFLSTGAIVAGVGVGIQIAERFGFPLPPLETLANPVYHQIPLLIATGSIGSAAFAYACWASWPEVIVSGLTAGAGMAFYYALTLGLGLGRVITCGVAAVAVGLAGGLLARRFFIPPLVTMIVGYTPMLPGLTLYRGMYAAVSDQLLTGIANLVTALAIAGALAAGVVLGERGARRLRRPKSFNPYRAFRRVLRPRVPFSPFAPRGTRRIQSPEHGPQPVPPVLQPRMEQDKNLRAATADLDAAEILDALDPVTETWEAIVVTEQEPKTEPKTEPSTGGDKK